MRLYTFVWKDGKTETAEGNNVANAFTKLGYGAGALNALDYYKSSDDNLTDGINNTAIDPSWINKNQLKD